MGKRHQARGFTLIELSVVLVIIGLIVGGVLVGQDLIRAAEARATIAQIEKYNTAVNTFYGKYGELPGDIEPNLVTNFGFTAIPVRAGIPGRGNGDGLIDAYVYPNTGTLGWGNSGENLFFWADLSANSQLIDGTFNTITDAGVNISSNAGFAPYLPQAKIGNSNYVAVTSVNGNNYFQLINPISSSSDSTFYAQAGLTVSQAYAIDQKMDDGLPQTGHVLATASVSYFGPGESMNPGGWGVDGSFNLPSAFSASTPSATTCYDTTSGQYSVTQNNGDGVNCALSLQFQ
jgi:prepilin-type N-terminal cleavage/methylation domain-containing protein